MFPLRDFIDVVAPEVQSTDIGQLTRNCAAREYGIRIDLGGVILVDQPCNGYVINITICNGLVVPRPIIPHSSDCVLFYDRHCIADILNSVLFSTEVRMVGDCVVSFACPLSRHVALPHMEQSLRIADSLGSHALLVETCSINTAIAKHFKKQLPDLNVCSPSMHMLHKTAFVFSTPAPGRILRTIDIRRCYTNALLLDRQCWLQFSVLDDVKSCDSMHFLKNPGRYWVKTSNYFPLKGDGWYYSTLLVYAFEQGIDFTASYCQVASTLYPSCLFRSAVEKTRAMLSPDDAKAVVNRFIGMLKTKPSSGRTGASHRSFVTRRKHEAHAFLASDKNAFLSEINGIYYCRRPVMDSIITESSRHFYDQVIERAWIMVYELWLKMKMCNGTLMCVKTDSVTASFGNSEDADSFEVCEDYREEAPPLAWPPPVSFNETVDEPVLQDEPHIVDVNRDHDFDSDPQCIIGRAGTGKTHSLSRILGTNPCATIISPTNRAAALFPHRGLTLHAFFNIHDITTQHVPQKQLRRIAATTSLLLVDEVFMCSAWMIQALYQLHLLGVHIIVAGDPWQLPAVQGAQLTIDHHVLHVICRGRFHRLTENIRCKVDVAAELSSYVDQHTFRVPAGIQHTEFDPLIRTHLTYTNKCADVLNNIVLKSEIRRNRKMLWSLQSNIGVCSGIQKAPDGAICFTRNTPVILKETCTYGTRNSYRIITKFTTASVTLDDTEFALTREFFDMTYLAYAITIHKAQGMTINQRYMVHEGAKIEKLKIGPRLLYVACTRCTVLAFVHICKECSCGTRTTNNLSRKLSAVVKKD